MDWKRIIRELRSSGLTLAEIGARTGITCSGVSELQHGRSKEPKAATAFALIKLHEDIFPSKKKAA